jgi:hypothetical protein
MSSTPDGTATDTGSLDAAETAFASLLAGESPTTEEDSEAQAETPIDEMEVEETIDEEPSDEDSEEIESPEPEEVPVYTVKVDGQELQVPLDELLKGYSRMQDYTRKTQKLAEERNAVTAEAEQARTERERYTAVLSALQQQIQASAAAEPDWDKLRSEDPIEFGIRWAEHQRRQQQMTALQAEQQRMAEIQQYERTKYIQSVLEKEQQALMEAIPEWADQEKAKTEKQALFEFGRSVGFTDQELNNVTDHRTVLTLRKAMMYDKLMSKRADIKPATKPAAPVLKPGAASTVPKAVSEVTRAKQRLAKSGSIQDAKSAFEAILNAR